MIDIQEIITLPEGKTLEFKRDLSSLKPILKTLIAFANTAGGTLIIGRDNDGTIAPYLKFLTDFFFNVG